MASCPVRLAFQDGEPEYLFEATPLLETMKKALPRFGQPDDLQTWMSGEDTTGYAIGAMATSIIVTSVLLLWAFLLFLCARAGPKRAGWLSGKSFVSDPPFLSKSSPTLQQQQQPASEAIAHFLLTTAQDNSGQSSLTAKQGNKARVQISPTESLLDADDAPVEGPSGASILSSVLDTSLPSVSIMQSMFIDDDDDDDDPEDIQRDATPPCDPGPPLRASPSLSPRPFSSSTSQLQQRQVVQVEMEVSALSTADPDPILSSAISVTSTTSEKYADYLKYLDEAMNCSKLVTTPQDNDDDSIDSDDMLLEDILADEPSAWTSDVPPPPINPDTSEDTGLREPPTILRSRPDALDLSFPDGGGDGFLFEENTSTIPPQGLPPPPTPPVDPDTPMSLPRSNFTSHAASRKRLLESFVENRKRSSQSISPLLVSDDSTMLTDVEHGLLVRPEPMAKVYDYDEGDDTDTDNEDQQSANGTNSSKDESISDLVDDLLAHAMAPSLDESESPERQTRGVVDLDETPSTMESYLVPPSWKSHIDTTIITVTSDKTKPRQVILRGKRETNSTQPTDHSTNSTGSHDDDGGLNKDNELPMSTTQIIQAKNTQDEYAQAHDLWLEERRRSSKRLNRLRIGVVFVATFLVIATLMGALNGAWALNWSRQAVVDAWSTIQSNALELQSSVEELRTLQSSIRQQLWNLWQLLDQQCPLVRTSICPLAYLPTAKNVTCNLTGIPLEGSWQRWLASFVDDTTVAETLFEPEDWDAFAVDLDALVDQPIEHSLDGWNWALWAAVACNCLLSVFALSILAAVSLDGATRLHYQLSTWSFATVYWITVLLAWIFGIGFMIGATLAVDSCTTTVEDITTPAITAKAMLANIPTQSFLPQYWDYIVDGCPSDSYPAFMTERVWTWGNTLPATVRIATRLQEFDDKDFLDTCGSPINPLRSAAETFSMQLCMVTQSLVKIRRSLGCDQWYPWYESMANEAICYQGSRAFMWSSACQIVVLVMAFLIWTMRVSFLSLSDNNNDNNTYHKNNNDNNKANDNNDNTTPAELDASIVEDGEITFL